jgi:hypothetical protein
LKKLWIPDPNDASTPKLIIYAAIAAFFIALLLWWLWPGAGHSISTDPEIWNFFGAYMSGVFGPLVNLAALWMLYVTVHQTRKVNAQLSLSAAADQRDRTFAQLIATQRELLARIGVNDGAKPAEMHPWRGIDGLLHLLNESLHNARKKYVELAAQDERCSADQSFKALELAMLLSDTNFPSNQPMIQQKANVNEAWKTHLQTLGNERFRTHWINAAQDALDERAAAYSFQLDTYHRHLAYLTEWIETLPDYSARTQFQLQLGSQLSWVEYVFIQRQAHRASSPYKLTAIHSILSQWAIPPPHAVANAIFDLRHAEH